MNDERAVLFSNTRRLSIVLIGIIGATMIGGLGALSFLEIRKDTRGHRNEQSLAAACAHFKWNHYGEAIAAADEHLRGVPNHDETIRIKSISLMRLGRTAEAVALLESCPVDLFRFALMRMVLALAYEADGQYAKAVELVRGDDKQRPGAIHGRLAYAADYLVEDVLRKLRATDPDSPLLDATESRWKWSDGGVSWASESFIQLKQYERAAWLLRHLHARNPKAPGVQNNLAWVLLTSDRVELRDPAKALALAKAAVARTQGRADYILDTLAYAYFVNGDVWQAVEYEKKAVALKGRQLEFCRQQLERFTSALSGAGEKPRPSASRPASKSRRRPAPGKTSATSRPRP